MIKSIMNCLEWCDGCPYWESESKEQTTYADVECIERIIIISCKNKAVCRRIIQKEKEKQAAEEGII